MVIKNELKNRIIKELTAYINKKLPAKQAKLISEFTHQYYSNVAPEELENRTISDLYAIAMSHWELLYKRVPGECKIHIFNPDYEHNGWQSTHTIVQVVQDDMPFLVDSIKMAINREGLDTYLMIHFGGLKVRRDEQGYITEVLPFNTPISEGIISEAPILIEVDRQTDPKILENLQKKIRKVLQDVRYAVEDWSKMRAKLREALAEIERAKLPLDPDDIAETKDFLRWLENDHFTFLGYRTYVVVGENETRVLKMVPNSGLGVLRDAKSSKSYRAFSLLNPKQVFSPLLLIVTKTNTRSTVHRDTYTDYIGIKRFNEQGELIGEHRFYGLYTSAAYTSNPKYIPFVRRKVAMIMKNSNLSPTGHAGKALLHILETLPRDDLFQASTEELMQLALGILHLQERKKIRMFARTDVYRRFISCLVFVPRERFTTELCYEMQNELAKSFHALEISFTTWFSESILARIHYVMRVDPKDEVHYDLKAIEERLIEIGRSWKEDLRENLLKRYGEEIGNVLFQKYQQAFSAGYRETYTAETAIQDIEYIEPLCEKQPLSMNFYRSTEEFSGTMRFKLFRPDTPIPLSDALPIFENMGLRVIGERPYEITFKDGKQVWISEFIVFYPVVLNINIDVDAIKGVFQEAFLHIWNGSAENDGFNRLVLSAQLNWREITVIRAYTKYLRQTEFTYSQSYIEECVAKYPHIAKLLVESFLLRFDPNKQDEKLPESITQLEAKIQKELDTVAILDEDRILRRIHEVINATLRTNFFQKINEANKSYLSFKLDPKLIPDMPLPIPRFEIFVYSPRFEGVHLRSSKVARGGIRWSDRREDYRTEILGLMKAQNVKNAVIVPSGAKGGFVAKVLPIDGSREAIMEEVIKCYQNFIRGLLDLADNLQSGVVITPKDTIRYDDDDPYLVVAADKGTATFSDIANNVAQEYEFWLEDAFASGGSQGYDHKKMGITARGAWESVKRHFRELNVDVQKEDITVIGIGDMGGDVFGNGMLRSRHIKLVGAFDHQHIFLDPDPDPAISFEERHRLFHLPRSSWEDYNRNLISKGGGVYRRTAKAIKISHEIKTLLDIKKDFVIPSELIKAILKSKVDLLWNGGIGTFVKSDLESSGDVGDRANDAIRINGSELRCRVVGEGGNLGFTQLGRVEYELSGGHIFTDFIDNSGGVDCSDHEVNIKILLNEVVSSGEMTKKRRNQLLAEMSDEVCDLVLSNNYHQTEALSLAAFLAKKNIDLHSRYIQDLARSGNINRELEFLPDEQTLMERKAADKALTRPELAILFAYSKILLKKDVLDSELPEESYFKNIVGVEFPKVLRQLSERYVQNHRLHREIIATLLSNQLVNEVGFTFIYQLNNETGALTPAIVKAYLITRNIFAFEHFHKKIERLDYHINAETQLEMMAILAQLIRRSARWFLRNRTKEMDIKHNCHHFAPSIKILNSCIQDYLVGQNRERYDEAFSRFKTAGVPDEIASFIAAERALLSALDIVEAANVHQFELDEVARTYFALSERLELSWLRDQINAQPVDNPWDALAKEACRDDLDWQQRNLTTTILELGKSLKTTEEKIANWLEQNKMLLERWNSMLANLRSSSTLSFIMFTVTVRELMDLVQINVKRFQKKESKKETKTKKNSREELNEVSEQKAVS